MRMITLGLSICSALAFTSAYAQSTAWQTIVNNGDIMPGTNVPFNSYNQPSVNAKGLVVLRARSKGAEGGGGEDTPAAGGDGGGGSGGGQPIHGIYERDMSKSGNPIVRILDKTTLVPAPNNTGVTFTEFPSFPRMDIAMDMIATRGNSQPVWEYALPDGTTTKAGTAGIFMDNRRGSFTSMTLLGAVPGFSYYQVPDAPAAGIKFDVFPGAPAATDHYTAFKGNWTDPSGNSQTGVYYRIAGAGSTKPAYRIADTSALIPGTATPFGSTAPPSAVRDVLVFVGLDNEDKPTFGGIYSAHFEPNPPLKTLVTIGEAVPGISGATLNKIGEGVSFDGRYVAFWGAWGTETRNITLICPSSGNKALLQYCNTTYPNGFDTIEPVNQGIFVVDTATKKLSMVARTGGLAADNFYNFIYWTFSGKPPGQGGSQEEGSEPPRWRSSAFTALSSANGSYMVGFKATKNIITQHAPAVQGIYVASGRNPSLASHLIVVDTTTLAEQIDMDANATLLGSTTPLVVSSVGVERDGFRNGHLALAISMTNADASVSWAGLYMTDISPKTK